MSRSVMKTFDENVLSIWNLKLYFFHVKCNLSFMRNLTYLLWKYHILRIAHSIQKFSFKFFPSDSNGYAKHRPLFLLSFEFCDTRVAILVTLSTNN